MTYEIRERRPREVSSTADRPVWFYNSNSQTEWELQIYLDSKCLRGFTHSISGGIYKHTIPALTYSLFMVSNTNVVPSIQRMYFDTVESAADYAQTYIEQIVNGGVQ